MIEVPNSYANQLRELAVTHLKFHESALALRAAEEMDEMDRLIGCLLDADERGRGVLFEEALQSLANLVEYNRRKDEYR